MAVGAGADGAGIGEDAGAGLVGDAGGFSIVIGGTLGAAGMGAAGIGAGALGLGVGAGIGTGAGAVGVPGLPPTGNGVPASSAGVTFVGVF